MKSPLSKIKNNAFRVVFWFLVLVVGITAFFTVIDVNDYYWHVKAGEYIMNTGTVPQNGIFSWYALENNLPWIAHEWLFEAFIYKIQHLFGEPGILIYVIFSSSSLIGFLIYNAKKSSLNIENPMFLLWISFAIISVSLIQSARPHMFMFLFIALLTSFLERYRHFPETKLVFLLPLLSIVWANVHGGSSNMVYILPGLFIIAHLVQFQYGAIEGESINKKYLLKLTCLTLVSAGVISLNPNGIEMLIYPYANMGDSLMLEVIQEWQSSDIKNLTHLTLVFLPIFIQVISLAARKSKIKVYDLLLFSFFTYLTLRSVRFGYLIYLSQSFTLFNEFKERKSGDIYRYLSPVLMGLAIGILLVKAGMYSGTEPLKPLSDTMLSTVLQESPQRVLNDYNFGGYLIFNDVQVFIDGRADMYSKHNLRDVMDVKNFKMENIENYLKEGEFDYILLQPNRAVNNYLKSHDDWDIIEEDQTAVLYKYVGKVREKN